jgi:YfiH family protein
MNELMFCEATWPAPANIVALTTTRPGGVSVGPYASFNLGAHVGDRPEDVLRNRRLLQEYLCLNQDATPAEDKHSAVDFLEVHRPSCQSEPRWLNQVHGNSVVVIEPKLPSTIPTADASYTRTPSQICAVLTADCLPVLLCNREGTEAAAVHVGWRGCLAGILANTLACFQSAPSELMAWLGPAIGPEAFEVGPEVREAFIKENPLMACAFLPGAGLKFQANLYQLATLALAKSGVNAVYGGDFCTVSDNTRFFSYRRDGGTTGRMATLIYIN